MFSYQLDLEVNAVIIIPLASSSIEETLHFCPVHLIPITLYYFFRKQVDGHCSVASLVIVTGIGT